jgi:peptidoglycan hydrolase-like protein with peptidoglycan-binding domain
MSFLQTSYNLIYSAAIEPRKQHRPSKSLSFGEIKMARKYTGWDGDSKGKRAGLEALVSILEFLTGNGLWNNGTWTPRNMRGKQSPSVHGTGRAVDLSWRRMPNGKGSGDYNKALEVMNFLVENADALFIEAVYDYHPRPHGRGWMCNRNKWQDYTKKTIGGAPGGDWFHIEISNDKADDPKYYQDTITRLLSNAKPKPTPPAPPATPRPQAPATPRVPAYPGTPVRKGSVGSNVKLVQQKVGVRLIDGQFGNVTLAAVKRWQAANGLTADGVVGSVTWKRMFG